MAKLATLADLILPATVLLSAVTLGIGIAACPLHSVPLMHTFTALSAATAVGSIASLVPPLFRKTPIKRKLVYEYGLIPLAVFWGALVCICTPSRQIREASARMQTMNDGKHILLAVHGYHDMNKRLPTDIGEDKGNAILSWRVQVLPYIDQAPLYTQFKLDKPWDDPANFALVEKNPVAVYSSVMLPEPGKTPWQRFRGPGTAFEPGKVLKLNDDFPDGTSNTIFCVDAQNQVIWSKPEDIPYGPNLPIAPMLARPYTKPSPWPFCCPLPDSTRFLACMMDGTVRAVNAEMPEERLRALIVRNDGQRIDDFDY